MVRTPRVEFVQPISCSAVESSNRPSSRLFTRTQVHILATARIPRHLRTETRETLTTFLFTPRYLAVHWPVFLLVATEPPKSIVRTCMVGSGVDTGEIDVVVWRSKGNDEMSQSQIAHRSSSGSNWQFRDSPLWEEWGIARVFTSI